MNSAVTDVLVIPTAETVFASLNVYFRADMSPLAERSRLPSLVGRWLDSHANEPFREEIRKYLRHHQIASDVHPRDELPHAPMRILESIGLGELERERFASATHGVAIGIRERVRSRRIGLWATIATAAALTEATSGVTVDPALPRVLPTSALHRRVPADGAIHVGQHIVGIFSKARSGFGRITTSGMSKFGLPNLEASDVPQRLAKFDVVVKGVGQYLVDLILSSEDGHSDNSVVISDQIHLTIQQVAKAIAGHTDSSSASNQYPVRLEFGPSTFYRDSVDMVHVLPPRSEQDKTGWIAEAIETLFGSESN